MKFRHMLWKISSEIPKHAIYPRNIDDGLQVKSMGLPLCGYDLNMLEPGINQVDKVLQPKGCNFVFSFLPPIFFLSPLQRTEPYYKLPYAKRYPSWDYRWRIGRYIPTKEPMRIMVLVTCSERPHNLPRTSATVASPESLTLPIASILGM